MKKDPWGSQVMAGFLKIPEKKMGGVRRRNQTGTVLPSAAS